MSSNRACAVRLGAFPLDSHDITFEFLSLPLKKTQALTDRLKGWGLADKGMTSMSDATRVPTEYSTFPLRVRQMHDYEVKPCKVSKAHVPVAKYPHLNPAASDFRDFYIDSDLNDSTKKTRTCEIRSSRERYVVRSKLYRKSNTFVLQNMVPVLLIGILSFLTVFISPEDRADRMAYLVTAFLALYAHKCTRTRSRAVAQSRTRSRALRGARACHLPFKIQYRVHTARPARCVPVTHLRKCDLLPACADVMVQYVNTMAMTWVDRVMIVGYILLTVQLVLTAVQPQDGLPFDDVLRADDYTSRTDFRFYTCQALLFVLIFIVVITFSVAGILLGKQIQETESSNQTRVPRWIWELCKKEDPEKEQQVKQLFEQYHNNVLLTTRNEKLAIEHVMSRVLRMSWIKPGQLSKVGEYFDKPEGVDIKQMTMAIAYAKENREKRQLIREALDKKIRAILGIADWKGEELHMHPAKDGDFVVHVKEWIECLVKVQIRKKVLNDRYRCMIVYDEKVRQLVTLHKTINKLLDENIFKVDTNVGDATHPWMLKLYVALDIDIPEGPMKSVPLEIAFVSKATLKLFEDQVLHNTYRVWRMVDFDKDQQKAITQLIDEKKYQMWGGTPHSQSSTPVAQTPIVSAPESAATDSNVVSATSVLPSDDPPKPPAQTPTVMPELDVPEPYVPESDVPAPEMANEDVEQGGEMEAP